MDDAFMFFAIATGAIPMNGMKFEHAIQDIQTLNSRALKAELDMTAISAARYPALADLYWIVSVGSSVGRNYGPLLISKTPREPKSLTGRRIAVPGSHTTAYLLLRLALPAFEAVEMPFEEIPQAVLEGKVDAGLVIHEWQLTYRDAGLLPVLDLGIWWQQETKLPLPLGLNAVKKSLGKEAAQRATTILRDSVLYAFAHQDEAVAYAMKYGRGTDLARSRQFIGMYVNEETLALTPSCRKALSLLFARAEASGLIARAPALDVIEPFKA
jgi:1,4-dihydroxy-6-naphthoate synthase